MESFKSLDPAMPEFQDLLVRLIPSVGLNFVSVQFFWSTSKRTLNHHYHYYLYYIYVAFNSFNRLALIFTSCLVSHYLSMHNQPYE